MSYTYLQERGEESSAESFSDIPPYVLSRLNLIAEKSCSNDNGTEYCQSSQSGTTCEPSMGSHGEEKSMSFAEDSRVRTYPPQEKGRDSAANEADYGPKWPESLAKYDRNTHSWKTRQCSLFGGLELFSGTWPRWGMMQDGECLEHTMPGHRTSVTESGYWPTPTCNGWISEGSILQLRLLVDSGVTTEPEASMMAAGTLRPERMETWDTPCKGDAHSGAYNRTGAYHGKGQKHLQAQAHERLTPHCVNGGKLNPNWVEWLMGWPMTWTDLQPLATDKFRLWLRSHGQHSVEK